MLAFLAIAIAAFGMGRPILRGLGLRQENRLATGVWSMALGLIAAGLLWAALGMVGWLYVPVIGVVTLIAGVWGLGEMVHGLLVIADRQAWPRQEDEPSDEPWAPPPPWLLRGVLATATVACLGSLVGALAPPVAGDALCYHLELPKVFLAEHCIGHLPYHDNGTFPLMAEMWYLWGLALDGGVCAQLIHWGLGLLLGLAAAVLAAPILGRSWAWIVAAVVVLTPGVNNQMTAPLNDVALAGMTTRALAAWWRAVVNEDGRRWFVVAGLTGGCALGTKYIALVFAAAVAVTWLWALWHRSGQRRLLLQGAAVVAVVAISTGGIWYVRAAWYRGNPVYPFLNEIFCNAELAADGRETLPESKSPLGRGPLGLAAAPWQVTMQPERFGGRGHQLGVLLLAAVPGVAVCRRLRGLGTLLAVAGGYFVLWYLLRQNVRFLFPMVPLAAVATVWFWIELRRFPRQARWIAATVFAGTLAVFSGVAVARSADKLAVAVGWEDRDSYLVREEPSYRAALIANIISDPGDHILSQDYRAFYFDRRVTRENVYRRHTHYDRDIDTPGELSGTLLDAGFTHLLLSEPVAGGGVPCDPTLSRLVDTRLADESAKDLAVCSDYRRRDRDGVVRRYRFVELCDGSNDSGCRAGNR